MPRFPRNISIDAWTLWGAFLLAAGAIQFLERAESGAVARAMEAGRRAEAHVAALSALADHEVALRDAVLSVRAYAVTGDRSYLRSYRSAVELLPLRWSEVLRR